MCVIASAVDLVFRLHRSMPDASRDISVKIYIVLFPIRPSAISPVIMSFTAIIERNSARYTATVECNAPRCQRIATVQCYCCKVFGWCRRHINNIRWEVPGRFETVCDRCYGSFEKSDTESDTPPKALPPPKNSAGANKRCSSSSQATMDSLEVWHVCDCTSRWSCVSIGYTYA